MCAQLSIGDCQKILQRTSRKPDEQGGMEGTGPSSSTRTKGAEVTGTALKKMSVDDAKKSGNKDAKEIVDKQEQTKREIIASFNDGGMSISGSFLSLYSG